MRRGFAFSWFMLIFTPLTLAWKLIPTGMDADQLKNGLVTFLSKHEYEITQQTIVADEPVIHAERGVCRIVVAEVAPEGWSRDLFQEMTKSMDRKFFVFDGKVYPDQPTWTTVSSDRWSAYLRRLGIQQAPPLVLAVAETRPCDAEELPWTDLLARPARKDTT